MTTAAHEPSFVIDVVYESHRTAAARPPKERTAARLQVIQRQRSRAAAEEAEFILRLAALCPDVDDPPPDHPGAAKTYWRSARSESPVCRSSSSTSSPPSSAWAAARRRTRPPGRSPGATRCRAASRP